MAKTTETAAEAVKAESKFSKEQLISAVKFAKRRDLLEALLKDGEYYTIAEVEKKMNSYLGKKVG